MVFLSLSPSQIRFTQDSIQDDFGREEGRSLEDTFRELLYGEVTVDEIRRLSVVRHEGAHWVVSGNRRLYLYRKLEALRRITMVSVEVIPINMDRFSQMLTTENNGQSVRIRSDRLRAPGDKLDDRLDKIYRRWSSEGRPSRGVPAARQANTDDSWCTIL